jgi:hypothetical protein
MYLPFCVRLAAVAPHWRKEQISQPGPESGPGFGHLQEEVIQVVPVSLDSGCTV